MRQGVSCGELVLFLGFTTLEAVYFFGLGIRSLFLPYTQFDGLSRITLKSLWPNLGCLQLSHARTQAVSVYNSLGACFFFPQFLTIVPFMILKGIISGS